MERLLAGVFDYDQSLLLQQYHSKNGSAQVPKYGIYIIEKSEKGIRLASEIIEKPQNIAYSFFSAVSVLGAVTAAKNANPKGISNPKVVEHYPRQVEKLLKPFLNQTRKIIEDENRTSLYLKGITRLGEICDYKTVEEALTIGENEKKENIGPLILGIGIYGIESDSENIVRKSIKLYKKMIKKEERLFPINLQLAGKMKEEKEFESYLDLVEDYHNNFSKKSLQITGIPKNEKLKKREMKNRKNLKLKPIFELGEYFLGNKNPNIFEFKKLLNQKFEYKILSEHLKQKNKPLYAMKGMYAIQTWGENSEGEKILKKTGSHKDDFLKISGRIAEAVYQRNPQENEFAREHKKITKWLWENVEEFKDLEKGFSLLEHGTRNRPGLDYYKSMRKVLKGKNAKVSMFALAAGGVLSWTSSKDQEKFRKLISKTKDNTTLTISKTIPLCAYGKQELGRDFVNLLYDYNEAFINKTIKKMNNPEIGKYEEVAESIEFFRNKMIDKVSKAILSLSVFSEHKKAVKKAVEDTLKTKELTMNSETEKYSDYAAVAALPENTLKELEDLKR